MSAYMSSYIALIKAKQIPLHKDQCDSFPKTFLLAHGSKLEQ